MSYLNRKAIINYNFQRNLIALTSSIPRLLLSHLLLIQLPIDNHQLLIRVLFSTSCSCLATSHNNNGDILFVLMQSDLYRIAFEVHSSVSSSKSTKPQPFFYQILFLLIFTDSPPSLGTCSIDRITDSGNEEMK